MADDVSHIDAPFLDVIPAKCGAGPGMLVAVDGRIALFQRTGAGLVTTRLSASQLRGLAVRLVEVAAEVERTEGEVAAAAAYDLAQLAVRGNA